MLESIEYQLALFCKRVFQFGIVPLLLLTAYLSTRSYTVQGAEFIVVDWITITGLLCSLGMLLAVIYWWEELGHGWLDGSLALIGILPFFVLLGRLDPRGVVNSVF